MYTSTLSDKTSALVHHIRTRCSGWSRSLAEWIVEVLPTSSAPCPSTTSALFSPRPRKNAAISGKTGAINTVTVRGVEQINMINDEGLVTGDNDAA